MGKMAVCSISKTACKDVKECNMNGLKMAKILYVTQMVKAGHLDIVVC